MSVLEGKMSENERLWAEILIYRRRLAQLEKRIKKLEAALVYIYKAAEHAFHKGGRDE